MKIAKSTYITLRISLPLLQTLPTVVFSEGLEVKVKRREFDKKNPDKFDFGDNAYIFHTVRTLPLNLKIG